jgi:hypothetical protein
MNKRYMLTLLWLTAASICSASDRGSGWALPIAAHDSTPTWLSVTATVGDGIIILDWKVAMEHNTIRYEILRTTDTTAHYTIVGRVKVAALKPGPGSGSIAGNPTNPGNPTDSLSYTFTDLLARPNTVYYYRLRQIGKDKQSTYSSIVSAKASDPSQKINIFPNPANTFIYVSNIGGQGVLHIYDQSGRVVLETTLGGDQQQINISTLKTGSYYARIDRDGKVQYKQTLIIN